MSEERSFMPTSEAASKALAIVDELLGSAARKGERGIAWARLALGLMVAISWPIIQGPQLLSGVPRSWSVFSAGLLAVVISAMTLMRTRAGRAPAQWLLLLSISADAVIVNGFLCAFVFWPGDAYAGVVTVHGSALVYISVVNAGVRLSNRGAILGFVLNALLFLGLNVIDAILIGDMNVVGPVEFVTVAACLLSSGVLSITIANRTRGLVLQSATEALMASRARQKLGAYVSPEVADLELKSDELRLGGQRREVAVLFTDLRGFTTTSEAMRPEDLVSQLNAYLSAVVDAVQAHGGVVDNFIGDAVMAVFGAPVQRADDAARAIRAARAVSAALVKHNVDRQARGLEPLRQGIGVHYGPVVAGNVGTSSRASYTVIGDTVNLASRLESSTKDKNVECLISDACIEAAKSEGDDLIALGGITVRGRQQEVGIFTLPAATSKSPKA